MIQISKYSGFFLILLGAAGYVLTGAQSITALIPAFFGILILILAILAKKDSLHRHMMHAVMVIALLGFIGSVSGVIKLLQLLGGQELARPAAAISQAIMSLICLTILLPGIKSFIDARKNKTV